MNIFRNQAESITEEEEEVPDPFSNSDITSVNSSHTGTGSSGQPNSSNKGGAENGSGTQGN